jgi:hypothetical protein
MVRWQDLKEGDRVEIVQLQNDPGAVPVGQQGTVDAVSRLAVGVDWDDPQYLLSLAMPEDQHCIRKVA